MQDRTRHNNTRQARQDKTSEHNTTYDHSTQHNTTQHNTTTPTRNRKKIEKKKQHGSGQKRKKFGWMLFLPPPLTHITFLFSLTTPIPSSLTHSCHRLPLACFFGLFNFVLSLPLTLFCFCVQIPGIYFI